MEERMRELVKTTQKIYAELKALAVEYTPEHLQNLFEMEEDIGWTRRPNLAHRRIVRVPKLAPVLKSGGILYIESEWDIQTERLTPFITLSKEGEDILLRVFYRGELLIDVKICTNGAIQMKYDEDEDKYEDIYDEDFVYFCRGLQVLEDYLEMAKSGLHTLEDYYKLQN